MASRVIILAFALASGCLHTEVTGDPDLAGGIRGVGVRYQCTAIAAELEERWDFSWCAASGIDAAARVVRACELELETPCEAACSSSIRICPIVDLSFPPE